MIGESICLGRDGIHFDLFIKVGRLIVTLSPAAGSHQPCKYLQKGCLVEHTRLGITSPFNGGVPPRAPPSLFFL